MVDRFTVAPEPTGAIAPEPEVDPNRPAWLDPKFETPEAQAQAYAELQAKATRDAQELARLKGTPPGTPAPSDPQLAVQDDGQPPAGSETPKPDEPSQDEAAKALADKAGVDITPYRTEFETTGDVKPESRAAIVEAFKKVLPDMDWDAAVNDYIEGKKALVNNDRAMVMEAAGGEDTYAKMVQWAAVALPAEQVAVYNKQVESGDRHATLFAVEGLRAKYEAAVGRDPRLLKGTGMPTTVGGYRNVAEWQRDVRNPQYKTDPNFRDEVQRRLAASNI